MTLEPGIGRRYLTETRYRRDSPGDRAGYPRRPCTRSIPKAYGALPLIPKPDAARQTCGIACSGAAPSGSMRPGL